MTKVPDGMEDLIDNWHNLRGSDTTPLHEYLGLTWDEYTAWASGNVSIDGVILTEALIRDLSAQAAAGNDSCGCAPCTAFRTPAPAAITDYPHRYCDAKDPAAYYDSLLRMSITMAERAASQGRAAYSRDNHVRDLLIAGYSSLKAFIVAAKADADHAFAQRRYPDGSDPSWFIISGTHQGEH